LRRGASLLWPRGTLLRMVFSTPFSSGQTWVWDLSVATKLPVSGDTPGPDQEWRARKFSRAAAEAWQEIGATANYVSNSAFRSFYHSASSAPSGGERYTVSSPCGGLAGCFGTFPRSAGSQEEGYSDSLAAFVACGNLRSTCLNRSFPLNTHKTTRAGRQSRTTWPLDARRPSDTSERQANRISGGPAIRLAHCQLSPTMVSGKPKLADSVSTACDRP